MAAVELRCEVGDQVVEELVSGSSFSGVGGWDLACWYLNIPVLWQIEKDKRCQEALQRWYPTTRLLWDISVVESDDL